MITYRISHDFVLGWCSFYNSWYSNNVAQFFEWVILRKLLEFSFLEWVILRKLFECFIIRMTYSWDVNRIIFFRMSPRKLQELFILEWVILKKLLEFFIFKISSFIIPKEYLGLIRSICLHLVCSLFTLSQLFVFIKSIVCLQLISCLFTLSQLFVYIKSTVWLQ